MTHRPRLRIALASLLSASVLSSPASAAPHQYTMFSFAVASSPVGHSPESGVIQADDGRLYGTTPSGGGGLCNCGVVYRYGPKGYQELASFNATIGTFPRSSLIQAQNGLLYGTTSQGGLTGQGGVYSLALDGSGFRSVHAFTALEGRPVSRLLQAPDGFLYGSTVLPNGLGNAFRMTTDGTVEIIHSFTQREGGACRSGFTLASDNMLYAVTSGPTSNGAVIRMNLDGAVQVVHRFTGADGSNPVAGLVIGPDGALYGVAQTGGAHGSGTVFRLALDGSFAVLHELFGPVDGQFPIHALARVGDYLYGTTSEGGSSNGSVQGTTFRVSPAGEFVLVHSFNGFSGSGDGANPRGDLTATRTGRLVGTTVQGGSNATGTLFKIRP